MAKFVAKRALSFLTILGAVGALAVFSGCSAMDETRAVSDDEGFQELVGGEELATPAVAPEAKEDAADKVAPPTVLAHERRVIELEQEGERPNGVLSSPWTCSSGASCYFDGLNGVEGPRPTFGAHSCGFYNLGKRTPAQNDMASSVWNRRSTWNDLFNWDGVSSWVYVGSVAPGAKGNLPSGINNIVDAVGVSCS